MSRKVYLVMPTGRLSWWIRASWLIRGSIACRLTCGVRAFDMVRPPRNDLRVPTTELEGKGGGRGVQYCGVRERSRAAGGRWRRGAGAAGGVPEGAVPVFNGAG